jgi:RNA polymerase sigma-54 factor
MKPGLSLRVSQHLALTPQLQQSIRLLQLSTLELNQEIEQMIQDNPFLELEAQELAYEEQITTERNQRDDEKLRQEDMESNLDATDFIAARADSMKASSSNESENGAESESYAASSDETVPATEPTDWEGDQAAPDDANYDLEMGMDAGSRSTSAAQGEGQGESGFDRTENNAASGTLQAHLHHQALGLRLSEEDRAALFMLIESLNDDGYLEDDFESLATSLGAETLEDVEELISRFSVALKWLQNLEPIGVGARDLAECIVLQLRAKPLFATDDILQTAAKICLHPLELLARRDVKRLAQLTQANAEQIKAAIAVIAKLEPKPARQFAQVERNIVIPDVIVRAEKRRGQIAFVAQLNTAVMPKLHVNDLYANALKGSKKTDAVQGLQGRLQEARWFIKNVQQRFDTILRVSQAIIERQSSFFKHGAVAMRPLVLREIADEIGMHESTISRVTTAKYMSTPYGTFELKYFFGSALTTETGGIASSTAVRELIKQFIDAESKAKPLSDNAICLMLKEQGIECARRTVAKYREALRIPVTSLRKTL